MKKEQKPNKVSSFARGFFIAIIATGIFLSGVGVGQGRIPLGNRIALPSSNKDLPENLDYSTVEYAYDLLKSDFDGELDKEKLLDGLKAGLAKSTGDPYTEYLNSKDAEQFRNDLNGTFTGIGAELSRQKDQIVVVSPISGFPAEKAGLRPKDVVIEINDESTLEMTLSEAVSKIRGEKGTAVKLKVIRDQKQELEFSIVRETIKVPSVTTETLDGNIGYIKIARFAEDTVSLTTAAAEKFKQAGVKGIILDVRNDPGGLLEASISVSSLWLPNGKTVLEEKRGEVVMRTYRASGTPVLQGVPTVVLINEGSASASEIVAGALKDNKAATVIGVKSFGKGSVQQLQPLKGGGVLKITIAKWYTPAGKNINKEGITPDQEVKRTDEDFQNNRDPQRDAAINFLKK